jgi:hypothetical protein
MRDFATQRLINAGNKLDALVVEAQRIIESYLIPDGIGAAAAMDALVYLFDGPQQREAQKGWREAVDSGV